MHGEGAPRRRSFWGWGWEDRSPDALALEKLARRVSGALGGELRAAPAPSLEAARVPPSKLEVPAALAAFCTADREARIRHTYGRSWRDVYRGFCGDFSPAPDLVAMPRGEEDVAQVLAWAEGARVAVVPYGGGTSVVSGVEPAVGDGYRGSLSLDLSRLDRVLEVDTVSRAARIGAGATGPGLEAQLVPYGLTLRHYPQSFEFSTLGGWIATRAGGHFATLYTHIDDLVESVRMVTPRGIWDSRRLPASGAGPSPDRLALGSEGTLGVITEAWVRLQARPTWRGQASVRFGSFEAAVAALRDIAQAGLYPANCRVLDPQEAFLHRVADDGSAVLLLAFESADGPRDAWLGRALAIAAGHGGVSAGGAGGGGDQESWRVAFFEGPYLLNGLVQLGVVADTFETACTWDRFGALHEGVTARMLEALQAVCGGGALSCRITHAYPDGLAPYYTFIGLGRGAHALSQWEQLKQTASDALLDFGGTITHHHAVGRLHRPWYDRQRPEPFARALSGAKRALDPEWILNPGVLVDPPTGDTGPGVDE
jgi:alkyldihydroxyacetonephosphate synthase